MIAMNQIDGVHFDDGAFAFLGGQQPSTRRAMFDVEPAIECFYAIFRGEDGCRAVTRRGDGGAHGIWNDETGAAKRIVILSYTDEIAARADVEQVLM